MILPNMSAAHDGHVTPSITIPAALDAIATVRVLVKDALVDADCDDSCHGDLQLAADELASVLVLAAAPDSRLHVSVTHDDEDVYVRMSVRVEGSPRDPLACQLTRQLLRDTVDSCDICREDDHLFGVLQRGLDRPTRQ